MLLIHLKKAKKGEKENFRTLIKKITIALDSRKTKMLVEFNDKEWASIKSFTVKKRSDIKGTTRFMSGKLLMSAKLTLKSSTKSTWWRGWRFFTR